MERKTKVICGLSASLVLATLLVLYSKDTTKAGANLPGAPKRTCFNNLTQIGIGLKTWSFDNAGQFPWAVSTNAGGSKEFSAPGTNGVDANAARHFQAMADELSTPLLLVCPRDKARSAADSFTNITPQNITYQLYTLSNTSRSGPRRITMMCPIDGNTLWSDGTVTGTNESAGDDSLGHPMHIPEKSHD